MAEPPEGKPGADDFAKTAVDREAVSFEEPQASAPPAPETGDPMSAGAPPRAEAPHWPIATSPKPAPSAMPAQAAVDPMELAATHRKEALKLSEEPPLDQLAEDRRVLAAGRAAGWRPGAPDTEDRALRIGLWVVVGLVALLVIGLCGMLASSLLTEPVEDAAIEEP